MIQLKLRTSRRSAVLSTLIIAVLLLSVASVWRIQISKVDTQSDISPFLASNPTLSAFAQSLNNTNGNISLTVQDFNYTSPDNLTKLAATSATIQVTLTPQGQNSRVDLDVEFNGVNVVSPSFTGRFSSAKLTGYVLVDPTTNKMIVSIVASTSVLDIIRGVLGI